MYGFIWNGKDKVKRQALISDLKEGGLKVVDIESMIEAQREATLKKNSGGVSKFIENGFE